MLRHRLSIIAFVIVTVVLFGVYSFVGVTSAETLTSSNPSGGDTCFATHDNGVTVTNTVQAAVDAATRGRHCQNCRIL